MSMLIEPPLKEIILDKIIIKRLKNNPEYHNDFIKSITSVISKDYDEITVSFAENITKIDANGFDEYGFFTIGKDIWTIFDKYDNRILGYEVITRKRGGSIKIGPTYLKEYARGKGLATVIINNLCEIYKNIGARKVYVTAPLDHPATAKLDFFRLNLKMEAILQNHYSEQSSERVCGRFLGNYTEKISVLPRTDYGSKNLKNIFINDLNGLTQESVSEFIIKNMRNYYDDIDNSFVDSIVSGMIRGIDATYEEKGKKVFTMFSETGLEGMAVATPKRGGVLKIAPFLLTDEYISANNVKKIINIIEHEVRFSRRKITIFLPVCDINIANILSRHQYICEGVLREPYKIGVDIIVFSKFL